MPSCTDIDVGEAVKHVILIHISIYNTLIRRVATVEVYERFIDRDRLQVIPREIIKDEDFIR